MRYALLIFAVVVLMPALAAASPLERRLHIGQAEASSYLKNDWNRFEENYLPLYVADDDPTTAWTEGVAGDGIGEWLRMKVSTMTGATKLRLRIRNGYQKTHPLFLANARARKVAVKLLPSGVTVERELVDAEDFQDITIEQPAGELGAFEVKILSSYPGKKYTDLCISDVQAFVTAESPENPAFEKGVFDRVRKWRGARREAAVAFQKADAKRPIPLLPRYTSAKETIVKEGYSRKYWRKQLEGKTLGDYLARVESKSLTAPEVSALEATRALLAKGDDAWQAVQVVARGGRLPEVDGANFPGASSGYEPFESCYFGEAPTFDLTFEGQALLTTDSFSVLEVKARYAKSELVPAGALDLDGTMSRQLEALPEYNNAESKPSVFAWALREGPAKSVRALLFVKLAVTEAREGTQKSHAMQLLAYGADGRLQASARDLLDLPIVTTYEWSGAGAKSQITGGHGLSVEKVVRFEGK